MRGKAATKIEPIIENVASSPSLKPSSNDEGGEKKWENNSIVNPTLPSLSRGGKTFSKSIATFAFAEHRDIRKNVYIRPSRNIIYRIVNKATRHITFPIDPSVRRSVNLGATGSYIGPCFLFIKFIRILRTEQTRKKWLPGSQISWAENRPVWTTVTFLGAWGEAPGKKMEVQYINYWKSRFRCKRQ